MIPNWDERDQHEHDEWDEHYDERTNQIDIPKNDFIHHKPT